MTLLLLNGNSHIIANAEHLAAFLISDECAHGKVANYMVEVVIMGRHHRLKIDGRSNSIFGFEGNSVYRCLVVVGNAGLEPSKICSNAEVAEGP